MRKSVKWSLILGSLCCLAGIGMITAGAMMGGAVELENSPLWGRMSGRYHNIAYEYQMERVMVGEGPWRESYAVVTELVLEVGPAGTIEIVEEWREDQNQEIIIVHNGDGRQYQSKLEGTRLKIQMPESRHIINPGDMMESITILVPERYHFRDVEVEVMAGSFQAQTLYADRLDMEVAAGEALISGGEIGTLKVSCMAGQVECYAPVKNGALVDCAVGSTYVTLAGSYEQYDYNLNCAGGSITLEGVAGGDFGGFCQNMSIDYHTGCKIELDCGAGEITIAYQEEQ